MFVTKEIHWHSGAAIFTYLPTVYASRKSSILQISYLFFKRIHRNGINGIDRAVTYVSAVVVCTLFLG